MKRLAIACALGTLGAGLAAAPASADLHGFGNAGFTGKCSFSGTATFSSPLKAVPGTNTYSFASREDMTSTCTGTLIDYRPGSTGGQVTLGTPNQVWQVRATATNTGPISCGGSVLTKSGSAGNGALQFLNEDRTPLTVPRIDGEKPVILRVNVNTVAAGNEVAILINGLSPPRYREGTRARGTAAFAADAATAAACLGDGVSSLDFSAALETGPTRRSNGQLDNHLVGLNKL